MPATRTERSPGARDALAALALLGRPLPVHLLMRLGLDPAELGELLRAGDVVERGPEELCLPEEARGEAHIERLSWEELRALRLRLAELLRAHKAPCAEVVEQLLRAHAYPEARAELLRHADDACGGSSFGQAVDCLRKALEIWPTDEDATGRNKVLFELGRCARNCGQDEVEREAWQELLRLAGANAHALLCQAHSRLAELAQQAGSVDLADEHLRAAASASDHLGPGERARAWLALALSLTYRLRMGAASEAADKALSAARATGDPAFLCDMLGMVGVVNAISGCHEAAAALVDEALRLAVGHQLSAKIALAHRRLANISEYRGDYIAERDHHYTSINHCERLGDREGRQSCLSCLSYALFRTGQWAESLEIAREVLADAHAHPELRAVAASTRLLVQVFRGEHRQAAADLPDVLREVRRRGLVGMEFFIHWAAAELACALDDPGTATRGFCEVLLLFKDTEDGHDAVPPLLFATAYFADSGDARRLGACVDALHLAHSRNPIDETAAACLAARAEAAAHPDAALALLREALVLTPLRQMPIERGHLLLRAGLAALRAGGRETALEYWSEAETLGRRMGWRPCLDRITAARVSLAREEGTASGVASPLTQRQLDVLGLVSSGLSNKEAAQRLNLSARTVEMHVARILERLNCRTRSEAIRKAVDSGWI